VICGPSLILGFIFRQVVISFDYSCAIVLLQLNRSNEITCLPAKKTQKSVTLISKNHIDSVSSSLHANLAFYPH
jgi:hypothetical protein